MGRPPTRRGPAAGPLGAAAALAALAQRAAASAGAGASFGGLRGGFVCDVVDEDYSRSHYVEIATRNCGFVRRYQEEIDQAIADGLHEVVDESQTQRQDWLNRSTAAALACDQAQLSLKENDYMFAANISVNAWGSIIMQGKECCVLTRPPYCIDTDWSGATVAIAVPLLILALLLIGALLVPLCPGQRPAPPPPGPPAEEGEGSGRKRSCCLALTKKQEIEKKLLDEWAKGPLQALPESEPFATAAASLFAALWNRFNFQEGSVENQFEHLISLLRSQVAMVADRAMEEGLEIGDTKAVKESDFLPQALSDLHTELLDGFHRWRAELGRRLEALEKPGIEAEARPRLCGAQWKGFTAGAGEGGGGATADEMSRQLAEVGAFLLVWGEAGNVRFMPEVLYLLTELVLESEPCSSPKELYGVTERESELLFDRASGLFLSRVIRPIYNVIFDEWYKSVDINPENNKDKKVLRKGLEAYMPPHVANYDDWNEFVADPEKLVEGLIETDGETRLFAHPHGERLRHLARVDWAASLRASKTKTHRELHSLWGVFASIHRVILVHAVLFLVGVVMVYDGKDIPESPDGGWVLLGQARLVRYAALGLLVPIHAVAWGIAQWQVTGPALVPKYHKGECFTWRYRYFKELCESFCKPRCGCPDSGRRAIRCLLSKPWLIVFLIPAITYGMIRHQDTLDGEHDGENVDTNLLIAHFVVSGCLCGHLLFVPNYSYTVFPFENLTHVPIGLRILRYTFWGSILALKFFFGMQVTGGVSDAVELLNISRPGMQSWNEITKVYLTSHWIAQVLQWLLFWCTNFFLFFTDTALWYVAGCGILGAVITLVQRHRAKNQDACPLASFAAEDAVAKIPRHFSRKVLYYRQPGEGEAVSYEFLPLWDRICEYMVYEDKISMEKMCGMAYKPDPLTEQVYWQDLSRAVKTYATGSVLTVPVPKLFNGNTPVEKVLKAYGFPDLDCPSNKDIQWRVTALARGLGLAMPRPYRCPYMPGLTVLIPHYGETILMQKKELFDEHKSRSTQSHSTQLIDWLTHKYDDEFTNFNARMKARPSKERDPWANVGEWSKYSDAQWDRISNWASMRQQTLFRTVAGMCNYHPAIQALFELQGDRHCRLGKYWIDRWDKSRDPVSECFTCIVAMQMYAFFNGKDAIMAKHTDYMLNKFPRCLNVAYIEYQKRGDHAEKDLMHPRQKRRYFSCLIDKDCAYESDGVRRVPRLRIELPGYPILGDGKGDNQNHAIIFMRGHYSQCIDANQGAYFEQMLLLPNALAEFRSKKRGDNGSKKIVGFPEHITSDIGSIGDFAASAEVAFGTILQRTYAVLGARMHYGHPDIMNKLFMIQQGGVSKATKTINLSEDIFAGMDFTLRGNGRSIKHCEYFNLAKGRDLGFNTVLGFFSKLASGTGEQVLTRQVFRLGQVMHLPDALSFYYAHAGYYLTQFFISWALPLLVFVWLLVLVSDCDDSFTSVQLCDPNLDVKRADIMAGFLAQCYSWIMLVFIFATMFPLFVELWMQRSFGFALVKVLLSYATMAPLLFVFQAKCIGHYVVNEFRYGGATYVATGRGLPTERRPFIGELTEQEVTVKCKRGNVKLVVEADGKVQSVTDCGPRGRARRSGIFRGDMITHVDKEKFKKEVFDGMMEEEGGEEITIEIKRPSLKVGGLYLDYAAISYYDGATLLFGVVLVFFTGGMPRESVSSLAWMFVSLGLTIIAWLYGPFIFNPYQYEGEHFWKDLETLTFFFLRDDGTSWVQWYEKTHLKVGRGLATALLDITFFLFVFAVAAWYVAVNEKVQAFASLYSQYEYVSWLYVLVLVPPIVASSAFTCIIAVIEACGGCQGAIQRGLRRRVEELQKEDETASPASAAGTSHSCTPVGVPLLLLSAIIVALLDVLEACYFLKGFIGVEWYKGLAAGLILKLFLLSAFIFLGEGVLMSRAFIRVIQCCPPLGLPLATWVSAHRMMRDILTALLVLLPQSFGVLVNGTNKFMCKNYNLHQILLYRDPGNIQGLQQPLGRPRRDSFDSALGPLPTLAAEPPPTALGKPSAGEGTPMMRRATSAALRPDVAV